MTWQGRPTSYERLLHETGGVAEHAHRCRCKRVIVCRQPICGPKLSLDHKDEEGRAVGEYLSSCPSCAVVAVAGASVTLTMGAVSGTSSYSITMPVSYASSAWTVRNGR